MNLGNVKETISIIYMIEIVSFFMYLTKFSTHEISSVILVTFLFIEPL
ncbi:hypothetical protein SASK122_14020 [Staphylococcus argenteus]|nr:hypothetical protein [Staphylococcus argenteus]MDH9755755.1 hypothetical protein [Staphylococcus argenteus]CDR21747.1 hypothetical protein ERS140095_01101 [Staphylococcus argenteus]SGX06644.1 Uncharacterised protein [Staphylococcus argenteus]SGX64029.1 Uncharacterised protein [Staphylococcus argenteus]SHC25750.1 Uncharacterised protein [Staphylococcus argenteus]